MTSNNKMVKKVKDGLKHLIQCHCILPQFKNSNNPIYHKFIVFSLIFDDETVEEKIVACNNCGILHKIKDLCSSEIIYYKEESSTSSIAVIKDFKLSLPTQVYDTLCQYNLDLPDFEKAQYILDNELWNQDIILVKEELEDGVIQGKILKFLAPQKFRIESYSYDSMMKII